MMPNLTTPVLAAKPPFQLDFASGIVSIGSCFADEIGVRLQSSDFHIEINPFGALYNPASIATALHRLIEDRCIEMGDLVKHEGYWHSWHHHGKFSCSTAGPPRRLQQSYPPSPPSPYVSQPADGHLRHSMDIRA